MVVSIMTSDWSPLDRGKQMWQSRALPDVIGALHLQRWLAFLCTTPPNCDQNQLHFYVPITKLQCYFTQLIDDWEASSRLTWQVYVCVLIYFSVWWRDNSHCQHVSVLPYSWLPHCQHEVQWDGYKVYYPEFNIHYWRYIRGSKARYTPIQV